MPQSSTAAVLIGATLVVVLTLWLVVKVRKRSGSVPVDRAATHMGRGGRIRALLRPAVAAKAKRFGMDQKKHPGLEVARTVTGNLPLHSSWEDTCLDIRGPRTSKTISRAIPAVLSAPGAVVATSNKTDLADACTGPRAKVGTVWLFDPQNLRNTATEPT
ncbi:type IV secretion protein [Renibacterium salmoninarum ATCC 33209]|uniref:Type IV secretion protein n=1 Tax=Renibacterium salmoninarum (strain ATCC 33209 / DSM 20767 / JCM 11484 / NBRC 15589 / NCIMB 2235) TaxID=288705 RepID=A9WP76_RENSM|nr:type IV secretory system conjugative DNA transfer family protein [Renibacterium salmoninarum]ABY22851.1 type IV secretion protein [Renibacterium salmoninarum ATCC 33209]